MGIYILIFFSLVFIALMVAIERLETGVFPRKKATQALLMFVIMVFITQIMFHLGAI